MTHYVVLRREHLALFARPFCSDRGYLKEKYTTHQKMSRRPALGYPLRETTHKGALGPLLPALSNPLLSTIVPHLNEIHGRKSLRRGKY